MDFRGVQAGSPALPRNPRRRSTIRYWSQYALTVQQSQVLLFSWLNVMENGSSVPSSRIKWHYSPAPPSQRDWQADENVPKMNRRSCAPVILLNAPSLQCGAKSFHLITSSRHFALHSLKNWFSARAVLTASRSLVLEDAFDISKAMCQACCYM